MADLVRYGDGRDITVGLQCFPSTRDGHACIEGRRNVKIQIAHLGAHGVDPLRGFKFKTLQDTLCLIADVTKPCGDESAVTERITKGGIRNGRDDTVGVGIAVACDINRVHRCASLCV